VVPLLFKLKKISSYMLVMLGIMLSTSVCNIWKWKFS